MKQDQNVHAENYQCIPHILQLLELENVAQIGEIHATDDHVKISEDDVKILATFLQ